MKIEEIKKDFCESANKIAEATDIPEVLKEKFVSFAWICALGNAAKKEDLNKLIEQFKIESNG